VNVEAKYGIPNVVKYVLSFFVLTALIYNRFKKPGTPGKEGLFNPVIYFFVIWSVILIISSAVGFNNLFYIQRIFADPYFFLPYVLPLILLFTRFELPFFRNYYHYAVIFIFPGFLIQLFTIATGLSRELWIEQIARIFIFDLSSGFLLLSVHVLKKKSVSFIVFGYVILIIFILSYYGRRGVLIDYVLLIFFMIIIRLKSPLLNFKERVKIYYSGLLMIIVILTFGYLVTSSYAYQRGFNKEAFEESRGMVFDDFFNDFSSTNDWIFGRGIDGKVLRSLSTDSGESNIIENGFLTILLKGGLLYLVPFVMILLRASYLGFFRSNNDLVKAMASLLLIYVIMMSSFNLPVFSTNYIFIWISVSVCLTPSIRKYRNDEVLRQISWKIASE